jgi:putative alpha-1,2-mannosidase
MLAHHKAQGYLPIWTARGQENHCMIGNHAIPVITDAYMKGFRGFDAEKALKAMVQSTRSC